MSEEYQNKELDRRIVFLEEKFATINGEMGDIKTDIAKIKTDVDWIKKSYWVIFVASVGGLITALFNLIGK